MKHVALRWTESSAITASDVQQVGPRTYSLPSSRSQHNFIVSFGDEENPPHCQCPDWERHHWPCKHFCAVFRYTEDGWDALPPRYKDSPFFTLDHSFLPPDTSSQQPTSLGNKTVTEDFVGVNTVSEDFLCAVEEDEPPSMTPTVAARRCREVLDQLREVTYLSQSALDLNLLHGVLVQAHIDIMDTVEEEQGLCLLPNILGKG